MAQVAVVVVSPLMHSAARTLTEGSTDDALSNGQAVRRLGAALGTDVEQARQIAGLDDAPLIRSASWFSVFGHWPVLAAVLFWLWLWLWHSRPAQYLLLRNAMLISGRDRHGVLAVFPVAPARLSDIGMVDTVLLHTEAYRVLQPPSLTNQDAAVPSLHVGWNLLAGIALATVPRHRVLRLLGWLLPVAMVGSVVVTANHDVLDAVAGTVVALVGLVVARWWHRRRPRADRGGGIPTVGNELPAPLPPTGKPLSPDGAAARPRRGRSGDADILSGQRSTVTATSLARRGRSSTRPRRWRSPTALLPRPISTPPEASPSARCGSRPAPPKSRKARR